MGCRAKHLGKRKIPRCSLEHHRAYRRCCQTLTVKAPFHCRRRTARRHEQRGLPQWSHVSIFSAHILFPLVSTGAHSAPCRFRCSRRWLEVAAFVRDERPERPCATLKSANSGRGCPLSVRRGTTSHRPPWASKWRATVDRVGVVTSLVPLSLSCNCLIKRESGCCSKCFEAESSFQRKAQRRLFATSLADHARKVSQFPANAQRIVPIPGHTNSEAELRCHDILTPCNHLGLFSCTTLGSRITRPFLRFSRFLGFGSRPRIRWGRGCRSRMPAGCNSGQQIRFVCPATSDDQPKRTANSRQTPKSHVTPKSSSAARSPSVARVRSFCGAFVGEALNNQALSFLCIITNNASSTVAAEPRSRSSARPHPTAWYPRMPGNVHAVDMGDALPAATCITQTAAGGAPNQSVCDYRRHGKFPHGSLPPKTRCVYTAASSKNRPSFAASSRLSHAPPVLTNATVPGGAKPRA